MHFMFREHVVRLRKAHIKWCGFRKPPLEKTRRCFFVELWRKEEVLFLERTKPMLTVSWSDMSQETYTKQRLVE